MKKANKLSSRKREKSTPAKAVGLEKTATTDDNPDVTTIIQKLEADNRLIINKYKDLEFQLEEARIINEFLNKEEPQTNEADERQSNNMIDIDDLKQTVLSLKRQKRDEEENCKYIQYILSEREADIEFLQLEMNELLSLNSSADEQKTIEKQLKEMNKELKTNEDQLSILLKEEADAKENIKKRENSMKNHSPQKMLPANWAEERSVLQKQQQKIHHKLSHINEKQKEIYDHFTALKAQFYVDLGIDEKELKKALFAEIEFNSNPTVLNLQNTIAAEIEYNNILETELNEVRSTTDYIKKYRETCFKRGKNQYELESSRKRLELLQGQLDEISHSFST